MMAHHVRNKSGLFFFLSLWLTSYLIYAAALIAIALNVFGRQKKRRDIVTKSEEFVQLMLDLTVLRFMSC